MFPILKHLAAMKTDFEHTMEGCDSVVRGQYSTIINTLHSTVSSKQPMRFFIILCLLSNVFRSGCKNIRRNS